ncbi:MAG: hypothetical protein DRI56_03160 [Chloroflexota bacterium]|nr:MAG: hypothetical protein DRI56_03160 [Chloroflexota bacterium]
MDNLQIFVNQDFGEIRVVDREGEPWFVAKDIAAILGYSETWAMTKLLDDDEQQKLETNAALVSKSRGGARTYVIINESGLYHAIIKSTKPEAKAFRKWVTSEVLPSIRKTGRYSVPGDVGRIGLDELPKLAPIYDGAIKVAELLGFEGAHAKIAASNAIEKLLGIDILETFGATALISTTQERLLTPTELGRELGGLSAQKVNLLLAEDGLQYKVDKQWRLTEEGKKWGRYLDVKLPKRPSGKEKLTPIQQIKWCESVLDQIKADS